MPHVSVHPEDLPTLSAAWHSPLDLTRFSFTMLPPAPDVLAVLVAVIGTGSLRPVRVLIVDDEVALASVLARSLRRAFASSEAVVETANTPEEAMQRVQGWSIEDRVVVISDYNLGPTLNGIALLQRIQARLPAARCVLMSGYSRDLFEDQLRTCRVDAVLGKPLDMPSLRKMVADLTAA